MPSSPKIQKESILQAALDILMEDGYGAVNIKAVANRLGCSTQPISWQFGGMDGLRKELIPAAQSYAAGKYPAPEENTLKAFEKSGWSIIDMAIDEPNLFHFLYMGESGREVSGGFIEPPGGVEGKESLKQFAKIFGISQKDAESFKSTMILYTYGVAVMVAAGIVKESRENVHVMVRNSGITFLKGLGASPEVLEELRGK